MPDHPSQRWLFTPGLRTVRVHQMADTISEALIYLAIVFAPWAFGSAQSSVLPQIKLFGCTQTWTVWTMSLTGYLLGLLLLVKISIRLLSGYQPLRWVIDSKKSRDEKSERGTSRECAAKIITLGLATCTALILLYSLISVINARSTYQPEQFRFDYHDYKNWLPHSHDSRSSWQAFLNYLGLAGIFWALRDWLLGKTVTETRAERKTDGASSGQVSLLPARLRRLLWLLSINGSLLAVEGIAQRIGGSNKLIWLMQPRVNREAEYQFGPYAYRANAAQYFNLLWPVALGFWWTLRRSAQLVMERTGRVKNRAHNFLLPGVIAMAACPIMSSSRGGAAIAIAGLAMAAVILSSALRRAHGATKFGLFLFFVAILVLGFAFGWDKLGDRMKDFNRNFGERQDIYAMARPMATEHPMFGTGPGTFSVLFQFYRTSDDAYWPEQLHNDWLETRITYGWVGSLFIALAFLCVLARRFLPGGIQCGWRFTALLWLSLAGCLIHALFDFPMQMYSVLQLFIVICAILFNLSRRADDAR